jgi:hypothetical protein
MEPSTYQITGTLLYIGPRTTFSGEVLAEGQSATLSIGNGMTYSVDCKQTAAEAEPLRNKPVKISGEIVFQKDQKTGVRIFARYGPGDITALATQKMPEAKRPGA